jgi:uncharacterized membrane protein YqjE
MGTILRMIAQLAATAKRLGRLLLSIGENRLELLMLAVQEERVLLLHSILLALAMSAFGMLAGMAITAAIVVWGWSWSPVGILAIMAGLYAAAGLCLYRRLSSLLNGRQPLSAFLDQLRKDRDALGENNP